MDCVRQIWKAEGIRGIFRGLNITIAREIPAFGLYFASYEAMTRRKDPTQPLGAFHMLMAGGGAGVVSWLFTYPIDFLKSRLQVEYVHNESKTFIVHYYLGCISNSNNLSKSVAIYKIRNEDVPRKLLNC